MDERSLEWLRRLRSGLRGVRVVVFVGMPDGSRLCSRPPTRDERLRTLADCLYHTGPYKQERQTPIRAYAQFHLIDMNKANFPQMRRVQRLSQNSERSRATAEYDAYDPRLQGKMRMVL